MKKALFLVPIAGCSSVNSDVILAFLGFLLIITVEIAVKYQSYVRKTKIK